MKTKILLCNLKNKFTFAYKLKNMKIKVLILTLFAALITLTSCKKLVNNSITVTSDVISAKFKSGTISPSQLNQPTTLAKFVQADFNLHDSLNKAITIADANGYIVSMQNILDGKVKQVVVENTDAADSRKFNDFYSSFGAIWVKFTTPSEVYNSNEEQNEANGYFKLCDAKTLADSNATAITIDIPEGNQKALKEYIRTETVNQGEKRTMVITAYGTATREIPIGSEFNLKLTAKTSMSLVKKKQ